MHSSIFETDAVASAKMIHQTKSFYGDHGQPRFDEKFPVLVYDSEQELVITACDVGLGMSCIASIPFVTRLSPIPVNVVA
jgi:hypothetical protein